MGKVITREIGERKDKQVPEYVQSAKFITAAKKEMDKEREKSQEKAKK